MEKFENAILRWRLYLAIPAMLAIFSFAPAFKAGFVYDDNAVWSVQIKYIKSIDDVFFPPFGIPKFSYLYYRPLVLASYYAENGIIGPVISGDPTKIDSTTAKLDQTKARLPHATTILMHAATSALVGLFAYGFTRGFKNGGAGALLAGAAFAANPIHAESVAFIAGRSDIMAAGFLLGGLLCAKKWAQEDKNPWLIAFVACFLCALLSKETALAVVLFLPLFLIGKTQTRQRLWLAGASLAPIAVYFSLRYFARLDSVRGSRYGVVEALDRAMGALGFYFQGLAWPWPIRPYVPYIPPAGWGIAALVIYLALLALAIRKKSWPIALGFVWMVAFLLPPLFASAINPQFLAQRYLYLPSVGLSLFMGVLFCSVNIGEKIKYGVFAGLVAVMALGSFTAAKYWESDVTFWSAVVSKPPVSEYPKPWMNLGFAHQKTGNMDAAQKAFNTSLAISSDPNAPGIKGQNQ